MQYHSKATDTLSSIKLKREEFLYIRTIFNFQAECVLIYMLIFYQISGCLESEDRRPLENEDPPGKEDLENEDPLEYEDLENEDPPENEDLENEDPLKILSVRRKIYVTIFLCYKN